MVVSAYTLIRTKHYKRDQLVNKIKKLRHVKEVVSVYGEYDIVVRTETDSLEELTLFIYNKLRKIRGLTATTTMITLHKR